MFLVSYTIAISQYRTKRETYTILIAFVITLSSSRSTVASIFDSYFVDSTNDPRNLDVTRYRIVSQRTRADCAVSHFVCSLRDARVRDHRNPSRFRMSRELSAISRRSSPSISKLISRTVKNARLFSSSFGANGKVKPLTCTRKYVQNQDFVKLVLWLVISCE